MHKIPISSPKERAERANFFFSLILKLNFTGIISILSLPTSYPASSTVQLLLIDLSSPNTVEIIFSYFGSFFTVILLGNVPGSFLLKESLFIFKFLIDILIAL